MFNDYTIRNLFLIASIVSLITLCFIAYGEVLGYYFTSIDAFPLLMIGKIDSLKDIFKVISSPLGGGFPFGTYYRPVSELSYGIDYLIWGRNPMGYHLTNILLHLANSIMIFTVVYFIFKDCKKGLLYACAWTSSVLFLLSPLSVNLVPVISRRQDLLVTFLLGLSLLSFAKVVKSERHGTAWYALSLLLGFLAIFSKESAFVLPLLIWFLSLIFDERGDYRERVVRAIKYSIPFVGFVLLNTALHVYLFGFWGVGISLSIYQHIIVAARSFFYLAGPLELLQLSIISKVVVFLIISLIVSFCLIKFLFKFWIRGFLDVLLSREWRVYTYLISFILTFMVMFTVTGKSAYYFHYTPNMALTILIVMVLVGTFGRMVRLSILTKSIGTVFVVYTIVYSPIFTQYSAWRNSSYITRQTIKETEAALKSNRGVSRLYLFNWPGFIGLGSGHPGRVATILVSYSMNAWAKWADLKSYRNVEFIPISYTLFPPGNLRVKFNYTLSDEKVSVKVEGCKISLPRFPYQGEVPFAFKLNRNKKGGELVFIRDLKTNERLFLYDTKGISIIDSNLKTTSDRERDI